MGLKYKHQLLLVDDESSILNSLKRLFRKEGFQILTATSGTEGLGLLKEMEKPVSIASGPDGALYLLDAGMKSVHRLN